MPLPQTEHDLVARLAPESPILFARARHILRDLTRDAVDRFGVGTVADGCWSILHDDQGWQAVHRRDGGIVSVSTHTTARRAVADAVAGLLVEAGTSVNNAVLETAGLLRPGYGKRALSQEGERVCAQSADAPRPPDTPCIALEGIAGRFGYFVCPVGPAPATGPFISVHEVFSRAVFNRLPHTPGRPCETLPAGTVLDGYGDTDRVFLFEPGTPFNRYGLWDTRHRHTHRRYRVAEPLRVYPSFPFEEATISVEDTTGEGRGYYLVDTIAALLESGTLTQIEPA